MVGSPAYARRMTYVDLRPDDVRPVQVQLDDGIWVDGMLEAERKVEGVWQGWVPRIRAAAGDQSDGAAGANPA